MNRKDLVQKLENLNPALANNALVPAYTRFIFNGDKLIASSDPITITCDCVDMGHFAVDGKTILGLLQNTSAEEIKISLDKDSAIIKADKSSFKLPVFGEDSFIFEIPDEKWDLKVKIDNKFINGIKICVTTAAKEENMQKIMGVTVDAGKKALYSCDGDAISRYSVNLSGKGEYLLPLYFCNQLLKLAGAEDKATLFINKMWVKAEISNGYIIYHKLISIDEPFDYEMYLQDSITTEPHYISAPKELAAALARAGVLINIASAPTQIRVAKGKLQLVTSNYMGDVNDVVDFKGHPDVEAKIDANLMHRSLAVFEEMAILPNCTVYKGEDAIQVVSNVSE